MNIEGMQEVYCPLCGKSLGWQDCSQPINRDYWYHARCPERLARRWGLTRNQVEELTEAVRTGISLSYPDFPQNVMDVDIRNAIHESRARLAAEQVLELLTAWNVKRCGR